jgi:ATP-binding cassette subfamily F protein 3
MPVLSANNLNKSFGANTLFRGVSCYVHDGDKIALIGRNGTGKTTLVRILAGLEDYDSGNIALSQGAKLAYLSQTAVVRDDLSLIDYTNEAFSDIEAAEREMRTLEVGMSELEQGSRELKDAMRHYDRLMAHVSAKDGFNREYRTKAALFGLGFSEPDLLRSMNTFSGGQVMRASLARLLLSEPDLMLLDEPTNHLDLSSIEWLEGFLKAYKGSMVLVSHDRYFLEAVVDHVWELEGLALTSYEGSYEDFAAQKEFNRKHQMDQFERQQEYMEKLADYIRRYKAGNRTTMAQSREKMLARLKAVAVSKPGKSHEMSIRFGDVTRTGKYAMTAIGLSKAYGQNALFSGLDLHVERGERLGIVGPNGSGKTTLIKILAGDMIPDRGEVRPGVNMKPAVFYQDIQGLDDCRSVLDHIYMRKAWTQGQARDYLARFLFRGDEVLKMAGDLSGGEKNRLLLGMMLLDEPNILILDEPTNHLDIASRHALEDALTDFDGTVIVASHDRYFLDRIATRILQIEEGHGRYFDGNYTFFRQENTKRMELMRSGSKQGRKATPQDERNRNRQERRQKERLECLLKGSEEVIEHLEAELKASDLRLYDPATYSDAAKADRAASGHKKIEAELAKAYERWQELHDLVEQGNENGL